MDSRKYPCVDQRPTTIPLTASLALYLRMLAPQGTCVSRPPSTKSTATPPDQASPLRISETGGPGRVSTIGAGLPSPMQPEPMIGGRSNRVLDGPRHETHTRFKSVIRVPRKQLQVQRRKKTNRMTRTFPLPEDERGKHRNPSSHGDQSGGRARCGHHTKERNKHPFIGLRILVCKNHKLSSPAQCTQHSGHRTRSHLQFFKVSVSTASDLTEHGFQIRIRKTTMHNGECMAAITERRRAQIPTPEMRRHHHDGAVG